MQAGRQAGRWLEGADRADEGGAGEAKQYIGANGQGLSWAVVPETRNV